jgi:hypothetical protein
MIEISYFSAWLCLLRMPSPLHIFGLSDVYSYLFFLGLLPDLVFWWQKLFYGQFS